MNFVIIILLLFILFTILYFTVFRGLKTIRKHRIVEKPLISETKLEYGEEYDLTAKDLDVLYRNGNESFLDNNSISRVIDCFNNTSDVNCDLSTPSNGISISILNIQNDYISRILLTFIENFDGNDETKISSQNVTITCLSSSSLPLVVVNKPSRSTNSLLLSGTSLYKNTYEYIIRRKGIKNVYIINNSSNTNISLNRIEIKSITKPVNDDSVSVPYTIKDTFPFVTDSTTNVVTMIDELKFSSDISILPKKTNTEYTGFKIKVGTNTAVEMTGNGNFTHQYKPNSDNTYIFNYCIFPPTLEKITASATGPNTRSIYTLTAETTRLLIAEINVFPNRLKTISDKIDGIRNLIKSDIISKKLPIKIDETLNNKYNFYNEAINDAKSFYDTEINTSYSNSNKLQNLLIIYNNFMKFENQAIYTSTIDNIRNELIKVNTAVVDYYYYCKLMRLKAFDSNAVSQVDSFYSFYDPFNKSTYIRNTKTSDDLQTDIIDKIDGYSNQLNSLITEFNGNTLGFDSTGSRIKITTNILSSQSAISNETDITKKDKTNCFTQSLNEYKDEITKCLGFWKKVKCYKVHNSNKDNIQAIRDYYSASVSFDLTVLLGKIKLMNNEVVNSKSTTTPTWSTDTSTGNLSTTNYIKVYNDNKALFDGISKDSYIGKVPISDDEFDIIKLTTYNKDLLKDSTLKETFRSDNNATFTFTAIRNLLDQITESSLNGLVSILKSSAETIIMDNAYWSFDTPLSTSTDVSDISTNTDIANINQVLRNNNIQTFFQKIFKKIQ